jgi:two-component system chemotaxis sensor kinase CheA
MVGLSELAAFTHHVETMLDGVREGALPVTKELVEIVLAAKDHIRTMLDARQKGGASPEAAGAQLISISGVSA